MFGFVILNIHLLLQEENRGFNEIYADGWGCFVSGEQVPLAAVVLSSIILIVLCRVPFL